MDTNHEQGLTIIIGRCFPAESRNIQASSRRFADPTSPSAFSTNSKNPQDTVSIHYQNTCRFRGNKERAKEHVLSAGVGFGADHTSVGPQPREFRVWHDSTGLHRQDAALVDYKAGIVHLSSSDGTILEIPKGKLSPEDLTYVQSQDVYKQGKRKVTPYLFRFPVYSLILFGTGLRRWCVPSRSAYCCFS